MRKDVLQQDVQQQAAQMQRGLDHALKTNAGRFDPDELLRQSQALSNAAEEWSQPRKTNNFARFWANLFSGGCCSVSVRNRKGQVVEGSVQSGPKRR